MARRRSVLSAALFVVEALGLFATLSLWLPLYRRLLSGPGGDRPGRDVIGWELLAVVVMQVGYWVRRRIPPPPEGPLWHSVLLGHVLLFLSRLAFVFVGSSFSLFIVRYGDTRPSTVGLLISIWALFAIFCFVLDLERIARMHLDHPRSR